jgi:hypothetical protein
MGCMYEVPPDPDWISRCFTMSLFSWGLIIVAGALGDFIYFISGHMFDLIDLERKNLLVNNCNNDADENNSVIYDMFGWKEHKKKYFSLLAVLLWLLVGWYCIEELFYSLVQ